jgi:hypothetical protein
MEHPVFILMYLKEYKEFIILEVHLFSSKLWGGGGLIARYGMECSSDVKQLIENTRKLWKLDFKSCS